MREKCKDAEGSKDLLYIDNCLSRVTNVEYSLYSSTSVYIFKFPQ